MISGLLDYLETLTWRHALITALLFAPFLVATLKFWGPQFAQQYGVPVLDLALGVDGRQAYEIIGKYGDAGRDSYFRFSLFDMFLPAFGAVMLVTWWSLLVRFQWPGDRGKLRLVLLVALAPMCADWLENVGFITQVVLFPDFSPLAGRLTLLATRIKLTLLIIAQGGFVLVLAGVIAHRVWRFFRADSHS